jgi:hypothetical protein
MDEGRWKETGKKQRRKITQKMGMKSNKKKMEMI